jgi:uncharacterized protein (TIGR02118 family)
MTARTALIGLAAVSLTSGIAAARPAELGEPMLAIAYPAANPETGQPTQFDIDYYRDNHLPLIMRLYGDSISRFELIQPAEPMPGFPPAQYVALANIYIADQEAFDAAQAQHGAELVADVPNFSDVQPQVTRGIIYGLDD